MNGILWHLLGMDDRPYRTAAEVAIDLGVSLRTVRRWVAEGKLRSIRVGRSVRIPENAYREATPASASPVAGGNENLPPGERRIGEVAADYGGVGPEPMWPDTPARLAEQRRRAATLMDRLAARGKPASGSSDTADAILDGVREEFGARDPALRR